MSASEIARLVTYLGGFAIGVFVLAMGVLRGDWELIGLGAVLTGVSTTSTANVPTIHDSIAGGGRYGKAD